MGQGWSWSLHSHFLMYITIVLPTYDQEKTEVTNASGDVGEGLPKASHPPNPKEKRRRRTEGSALLPIVLRELDVLLEVLLANRRAGRPKRLLEVLERHRWRYHPARLDVWRGEGKEGPIDDVFFQKYRGYAYCTIIATSSTHIFIIIKKRYHAAQTKAQEPHHSF
jgi:hypothetical protein